MIWLLISFEQAENIKYIEDPALVDEVCDTLIVDLNVPVLEPGIFLPRRELLYPAHLIGHLMLLMLKYDLVLQLRQYVNVVIEGMGLTSVCCCDVRRC
jgi:myosin-5